MDTMELTTGMIVEIRSGELYRVLCGVHGTTDMLAHLDNTHKSGIHIKYYDKYLSHNTDVTKDIIAVWGVASNWADVGRVKGSRKWRRPNDIKEMTVADIEAQLGYSIKVVK